MSTRPVALPHCDCGERLAAFSIDITTYGGSVVLETLNLCGPCILGYFEQDLTDKTCRQLKGIDHDETA